MKRNAGLVMAMLIATSLMMLPQTADASITKENTRQSKGGKAWLSISHTFGASLDTVYSGNFTWASGSRETMGNYIVESSTLNGDSLSFNVRLQVSTDGTNWETFTIGTDSTSWYTALSGSNYKPTSGVVTQATQHGWFPYNRWQVFGKSTYNIIGGKFRLKWIDNN